MSWWKCQKSILVRKRFTIQCFTPQWLPNIYPIRHSVYFYSIWKIHLSIFSLKIVISLIFKVSNIILRLFRPCIITFHDVIRIPRLFHIKPLDFMCLSSSSMVFISVTFFSVTDLCGLPVLLASFRPLKYSRMMWSVITTHKILP